MFDGNLTYITAFEVAGTRLQTEIYILMLTPDIIFIKASYRKTHFPLRNQEC